MSTERPLPLSIGYTCSILAESLDLGDRVLHGFRFFCSTTRPPSAFFFSRLCFSSGCLRDAHRTTNPIGTHVNWRPDT